ncbi:YciI family protein [Ornithinimicrobium tianjinense]|uniref:YCII-related domain-containing protein n=1 Tax=Ornithinimicrobium tianjinense TaxID=1195761 RepID=A0A917F7T7_9MICO|nr:YciI family protein [Ornithinimicrobium tianjinense]GGF58531.1 hypothetical protein GCM10011366_27940 [Ornithinimicrobium tianjinense]
MPQYAVLIYSAESAHTPGETADTSEAIAECDEHAEALITDAVMTAAWAFTPRSMARSVRADGVSEGPFYDTPDALVGFYVLEAPDLDTALATAATNSVVRQGGGLEVRPIHSGGFVGS